MWLRYYILLISLVFSQANSTWEVIQSEILDQNCTISCHVEGSSFAEQSNLILTEDDAYDQLVNALPHNNAALSDGLLRVGTTGLTSLYSSFLWEKINAPNQEHYYTDHPYYGSIMPLGLPYLTNGELDFIREWILGNAPETGEVADTLLLQDTTRYEPPAFEILPPPEQGFQFHLGPFEISSGLDREFFYYHPLEESNDIFIEKVEINMRPGSHHFIAYTFGQTMPGALYPEPFVYRDLRDDNGNYIQENMIQMAFHEFGAGTQWPRLDFHFPPGVALRMNPNLGFDLNSHYVNFSDTTMIGEVYLNLHTVDEEQVVKEANILVMNNNNINLPPNQVTTLTRTFWISDMFQEPISIFQLFSHAHQYMLEFKVYIEGGEQDSELIYIANDWSHPPILELDPPLQIDLAQGLTLEATYDNWTDETIEFGFLSTDEMMILFGYYYLGDSPSAVPLSIQEGWNLVGLPFEYDDTSVESIFPESILGTLYQFDGAYSSTTELEFGNGYWLYFDEPVSTVLSGIAVETNVVNLMEGWNLISGISTSMSIDQIYDPQNIIVSGTVYGFIVTYFQSEILFPGKGYWVNANQNGSVMISLNEGRNKPRVQHIDDKLNSISVGRMSLYFGETKEALSPLSFSLPPKPPSISTDIRFLGDTKLCMTDECVIEVMNDGSPLRFECNIKDGEGWELIDGSGNMFPCQSVQDLEFEGDLNTIILRKSISHPTPKEFELFPSYPNPFNPITTLRYDLPEQAFVTLTIYDMLGREVTQLVKTIQQAGFISIQWDATDSMGRPVSAGIYLYQIKAGEFVQTKKMVLLK